MKKIKQKQKQIPVINNNDRFKFMWSDLKKSFPNGIENISLQQVRSTINSVEEKWKYFNVYVSASEIMKRLGVSRNTLQYARRIGALESVGMHAHRHYYSISAVLKWIAKNPELLGGQDV